MTDDSRPQYADRLRIEMLGTKYRIWHESFGRDRGEVALIAEVENQDGAKWRVALSRSRAVPPSLLEKATPCDIARWIADQYNSKAERVAQECFQLLESKPRIWYPEDDCRRAVHNAGLPEAINWPTDPESLLDKIRHWAHLAGPPPEPTRPGLPARDATVRQQGRTLVSQFLDIDCSQSVTATTS